MNRAARRAYQRENLSRSERLELRQLSPARLLTQNKYLLRKMASQIREEIKLRTSEQ
jgi:hypothetical protein